MKVTGPFLRVGLLVMFGVAAVVGLVVFFGGDRITNGRDFETYFSESVQGLNVGSAVKFRGVTLGQVTEIGLAAAAYGDQLANSKRTDSLELVYARFRVDLSKVGNDVNVEDAIKRGLRARLATQGITGISYLELDFVPSGANPPIEVPWHPRDTYLPSIPSTLIQVQDAAQQLLEKLNGMDIKGFLDGISGFVGDLHGQIEHGDVHVLLTQASQSLRDLDDVVRAANLPAASAQVQQAMKAVGTAADGPATRQLIASANQAAAKLAALETQLAPLLATLQSTARRSDNSIADLQQTLTPALRDLQTTLSNLRETSAQLRRDPGQVLFGNPPPGARSGGRGATP